MLQHVNGFFKKIWLNYITVLKAGFFFTLLTLCIKYVIICNFGGQTSYSQHSRINLILTFFFRNNINKNYYLHHCHREENKGRSYQIEWIPETGKSMSLME